jgi:CheY-like chemotaxis protein
MTHKPDLMLLDISLGGMSGFDVARNIAALDQPPAFIFLTMHDQLAYREKAQKLGALGFVLKDHFVDDLPPILDYLLASRLPPAAILDLDVLARLSPNNSVRYEKYTTLFRLSMEDILLQVDAACAAKDMALLGALGHRAKSTAMNVGAAGLTRQCLLMELAAKALNAPAALVAADTLRPLYQQTCAVLPQHSPPVSGQFA